jgi:16S rRNA (guanine527-N7)-methyltransferase
VNILTKYFPELSSVQIQQFAQLQELYTFWNAQINVISRKDTDNFYTHHVLHSLGIAKICEFKSGSSVLDIGTGGGFPGIPLAILFPETSFVLVDSIGKKIKVVNEVAQALGLTNVTTHHARAEEIKGDFDFIVSRAVTQMPIFLTWVKGKVKKKSDHDLVNGILYLKGGDLSEEMKPVKHLYKEFLLSDIYDEPFFETKKVIYVKLR